MIWLWEVKEGSTSYSPVDSCSKNTGLMRHWSPRSLSSGLLSSLSSPSLYIDSELPHSKCISQLITHRIMYLSGYMLAIVSRKIIWDTVLKVLLEFKKKKKNCICSFFWSIRWVFPLIFGLLWVIIDLSICNWMAWMFPVKTTFSPCFAIWVGCLRTTDLILIFCKWIGFFLVFLPAVHQLFSLSVENSSPVTLPTLVWAFLDVRVTEL